LTPASFENLHFFISVFGREKWDFNRAIKKAVKTNPMQGAKIIGENEPYGRLFLQRRIAAI